MAHLTVFGAGSWGTAVAQLAAQNGHDVSLWCRRSQQARSIAETRRNPDYLENIQLDPGIVPTSSLAEAAVFGERWIFALPAQHLRETLRNLKPLAPKNLRVCNLAKGLEISSGHFMSGVCHEELPMGVYSILSGPSHAEEVATGLPAAVVVASSLGEEAFEWQVLLGGPTFRIYTSMDVAGIEVAGALKNVIAIAAGVARGMSMGANATAALVTRGLAEMMRFGAKFGAHPLTFSGLGGVGDLIATCSCELSRNFRLGYEIGRGTPVEPALLGLGQVAEGYYTAEALRSHAEEYGVEMPISAAVYRVLYEKERPIDMLEELLLRDPKAEFPPEMIWASS